MVPHDSELRAGERKFKIGDKTFNGYEHNKMWRNNGDGTFTEIGWAAGADIMVDTRSCVIADFDRDGRQDIAVRTMYERSYFLRNEGEIGHFINLSFIGTKSNRMGVGTRVEAHYAGKTRIGEMTVGSGFLSEHEQALHFGVGESTKIDKLRVVWPSGIEQIFTDVAVDKFITITEGDDKLQIKDPARIEPPARGRSALEDKFVKLLRDGNFTDLDGKKVRASDLMKAVTMLHVWSPSCIGCEKQASTIEELRKIDEDGDEFAVLAVAVQADAESVKAFLKKHDIRYPVVIADAATAKGLMDLPQVPWSLKHKAGGGWFEVGAGDKSEFASLPWSGIFDKTGLQRRYRGPVKYFEAKLDILSSLEESRRNGREQK